MVNAISRQLLDLWNRYRPTIAVDAIEYDRELKKLLGTNLAEVGTGCISRQAAIDALNKLSESTYEVDYGVIDCDDAIRAIEQLPPAQPEQTEMIKEIRKWINSANRGNTDYFIVDKIEEIINRYE